MFSDIRLKVLLTDLLGVFVIIASVLLSWVPGPGGIPLFLIGLTLLAKNHTWASRLLEEMKKNGAKIFRKFNITRNKSVQLLFDILGIAFVGLAIWFVTFHSIWSVVGSVFGFLGVSLLLANRERLQSLFKKH